MNGARLLPLLFVCLAALPGHAEALLDPTRPALERNVEEGGENYTPNNAAGLQSIVRRNNGKPAAMINGELVELNGRVGDARLVQVGEDFVVLRGPTGKEVLHLTPGIAKAVPSRTGAARPKHTGSSSEEMKK